MKRAFALLAVLAPAACAARTSELPPHGEALFVVDTDLAVPQLAGRLRVDVYSEEGVWLDARDIGRSDPHDWPASFSVYSDDDTRERRALVRLRVYPEGSIEPYLGERNAPPAPFVEPHAASTLDDLCASAPELAFGEHVTGRFGATTITTHTTAAPCPDPTRGGAFAARVTVTAHGRYRLDVSGATPFYTDGVLSLRGRCDDPATQLACAEPPQNQDPNNTGHFPRFDATLDPGTYAVVFTSTVPDWTGDVTLEATPLDTAYSVPPEPVIVPPAVAPRLVQDGLDRTPETEPVPTATVDRLVLVRLVPGVRGSARVMLTGSCAGTNAILGPSSGAIDATRASTCIDTSGVRIPVVETSLDPSLAVPASSVAGTFGPNQPCAPDDGASPRACIPGGVFLFGTRDVQPDGFPIRRSAPERIAVMPRFWLDRYEVTVARFRDAIARGFVPDPNGVEANEAPIPATIDPLATTLAPTCTWSTTAREREDHPVNCIAWAAARALCNFEGGDLPTEAEWEYAAKAAGRTFPSFYPWGEEAAGCARGVFQRFPTAFTGTPPCPGFAIGTASVFEDATPGRLPDVTPQGVRGLGGNVTEWMLDSMHGFDDACWTTAALVSPRCFEENAPFHAQRGSNMYQTSFPSTLRLFSPTGYGGNDAHPSAVDPGIGFRCAYHEASR